MRSALPTASQESANQELPLATGTCRCEHPRCLTCSWINTASTVISHSTKLSYSVGPGNYNCKTPNVVYVIKFSCGELYIGETSRALKDRITGHRNAIRHQDLSQPVAAHYATHNHCAEDLSVCVLQKCSSDSQRFIAEKKWISQLVTDHPLGLNLEHVLAKDKRLVRALKSKSVSDAQSVPSSS